MFIDSAPVAQCTHSKMCTQWKRLIFPSRRVKNTIHTSELQQSAVLVSKRVWQSWGSESLRIHYSSLGALSRLHHPWCRTSRRTLSASWLGQVGAIAGSSNLRSSKESSIPVVLELDELERNSFCRLSRIRNYQRTSWTSGILAWQFLQSNVAFAGSIYPVLVRCSRQVIDESNDIVSPDTRDFCFCSSPESLARLCGETFRRHVMNGFRSAWKYCERSSISQ